MTLHRHIPLIFALLSVPWVFANPTAPQKDDDKDYSSELPQIPPLSPADSLKAFRIHPGFRIELAAAEPMLASPVALDFDEDGRLYVAEYPEYNQSSSSRSHGHGCVRLLEDTDHDGVYDKSTNFLADLDSPTAVCCYGGGVFVGVVPNILFAKDSDGDGKADECRVVYTGFSRDESGDAMMNSLRWLFDNRIHISTSHSGGQVRHADKPDQRPVSVRGQGFLFEPRTESFEVTSGGGQHGMSMDDWGRTFVNNNHEPVQLLMYDRRYLTRNPYLEAPAPAVKIAPSGYDAKVFRISPNEPWRVVRTRLRTMGVVTPNPNEGDQPSGFFTAASGVTVYRGDAWSPEFRGNVFVGEVANNLIFRARIEQNGVGLIAERADQDAEFLASTDIWFRPVQMANGPDGALYVIDMYRGLIEAAAFLPPAILKHLDVSGGYDKGRLYRIVPEGFQRPKWPQLSKAPTAELVALLEHPNGWHRDTASRLLYQRQDPSAVATLKRMAAESKSPLGRMHAMYALDGLNALDVATVLQGLDDVDSHVREHAVRLAEAFETDSKVRERLKQLTDDSDVRVRLQLAFSFGSVSGELPTQALVQLAQRDSDDPWFRLAILCSVNGRSGDVFRSLAADKEYRDSLPGRRLLLSLAGLIGAANRANEITALTESLDALPVTEQSLMRELVRALVTKLPPNAREQFAGRVGGKAANLLAEMVQDALKAAPDETRSIDDRVAAIRMLGLAPFSSHQDLYSDLLKIRQPQPVQAAVVETLAQIDESCVAELFLKSWPGLSPQIRVSALDALLSRPRWISAFLDAVEQDKVSRADVDRARIQTLTTYADARIGARAAELFGTTTIARRQDVVAEYRRALELAGDPTRGKAVFKKECSACHKLEGVGSQIGADLHAIRDQAMEAILLNILDPNREVKPQFQSYVAVTDTGRILTGMITAETANSVTIRRADETTETLLRIHIDDLKSTGISFMPEGLEKQIDVPAMADLLAYLTSIQ